MSHIRSQSSRIPTTELDSLAAACKALGCTLDIKATTYRWYGGRDNCRAAIKDNDSPNAYQVGLNFLKNGNVEFKFDTYGNGRWIKDKLMRTSEQVPLSKLQEQFQAEVFRKLHQQEGYTVEKSYYDEKRRELVTEAYLA